jgi:hypothetical protein
VITPRHDYYPLTPHAQRQLPWFLRRWVTPWEPPGRNVVGTAVVCVRVCGYIMFQPKGKIYTVVVTSYAEMIYFWSCLEGH